DAEVEREAGEKRTLKAELPQVAGESGLRLAIVVKERRIRIYMLVITLSEDQFSMRDIHLIAQLSSRRALNAMIRPQNLGTVEHLDYLVGLPARVRRRKR